MSSQTWFDKAPLVFLALFALRVTNSYYVKTFFQPDEYFQSLEPAWQWAFGPQSGAWITWEWKEQLRSSLHPLIFASGYRAADHLSILLKLDSHSRVDVLHATPRLIQALFAAMTDYFTWSLAKRTYGSATRTARAALALTVASPWQWFCSVRTFSNSLEASLTIVALEFFPWEWLKPLEAARRPKNSRSKLNWSLICAAMASILRPTNILVWLTVTACALMTRATPRKTWVLLAHAVVCGTSVLAVSVSADRTFYGVWTFPPLRFLYFNIIQSLAGFYGINRPDYYFTEGLPLLLTTTLPFAIFGLYRGLRPDPANARHAHQPDGKSIQFTLSMAIVVSVLTLSLISHKEVRFIYPLLPMLHVLAANPFARFFAPFSVTGKKTRACVLALGLAANLGIAGYVSLVHQRGVVDVMYYLRDRQAARELALAHERLPMATAASVSIAFLMPCHSTPWRTHLGYSGIEAWALTCEPPIGKTSTERELYMDEADIFYADPPAWIKSNMAPISTIASENQSSVLPDPLLRAWPEFLVFFEQLLPDLQSSLYGTDYRECRRFFNTHWHDDWRRRGDVVVWCTGRKELVAAAR